VLFAEDVRDRVPVTIAGAKVPVVRFMTLLVMGVALRHFAIPSVGDASW
jgi:hypothetical protein